MRLVEGVTGEWLNERENLLRHLLCVALIARAFEEILLFLGHYLRDLLAHCLADDVCLSEGVSGKGAGDLQDLVLIDDDAVGFFENVLKRRMRVVRSDTAMLGVDESRYVFHRAGAIERDHGGDIAKGTGLQVLDIAGHA